MSNTATITQQAERIVPLSVEAKYPEPLQPSGALDKFTFEESTPVIGREYPKVNLVDDIINAPNADELIRDLAITSMPFTCPYPTHLTSQSPNEASSSSAPKTTSQTNSTNNSSTVSAN
jgi:hypothetical protein